MKDTTIDKEKRERASSQTALARGLWGQSLQTVGPTPTSSIPIQTHFTSATLVCIYELRSESLMSQLG